MQQPTWLAPDPDVLRACREFGWFLLSGNPYAELDRQLRAHAPRPVLIFGALWESQKHRTELLPQPEGYEALCAEDPIYRDLRERLRQPHLTLLTSLRKQPRQFADALTRAQWAAVILALAETGDLSCLATACAWGVEGVERLLHPPSRGDKCTGDAVIQIVVYAEHPALRHLLIHDKSLQKWAVRRLTSEDKVVVIPNLGKYPEALGFRCDLLGGVVAALSRLSSGKYNKLVDTLLPHLGIQHAIQIFKKNYDFLTADARAALLGLIRQADLRDREDVWRFYLSRSVTSEQMMEFVEELAAGGTELGESLANAALSEWGSPGDVDDRYLAVALRLGQRYARRRFPTIVRNCLRYIVQERWMSEPADILSAYLKNVASEHAKNVSLEQIVQDATALNPEEYPNAFRRARKLLHAIGEKDAARLLGKLTTVAC